MRDTRDTLVNIFFAWLVGMLILATITLVAFGVTALIVHTLGTSVPVALGVFVVGSAVISAVFYQLFFDGGF